MLSGLSDLVGNFARENSLCSAVCNGDFNVVSRMLSEQFDPNSGSDYDLRYMTALERAVDELHVGIAALLFVHGADPTNNAYQGEEPDQASCYGYKAMDVRSGFKEAFKKGEPIAGFPGLHALLCANQGQPRYKRMRSILFLMEASKACSWNNKLLKHLRISFGGGTVSHIRTRLRCTLLCLNRALPRMSRSFSSELTAFVMLEEVESAFLKLAQTNTTEDESFDVEASDNSVDGNMGSHLDPNFHCFGGASSSHADPVLQDVHHDEPAALIHPVEAACVTAQMEAGFVERLVAPSADTVGECCLNVQDDIYGTGGEVLDFDNKSPFSRLVMLNFTRHPKSFEAGIMHDEGLREVREALNRSGLRLRLPSGAFVVLSPDEYPVAMQAVKDTQLTASHVIVSEALEPVVLAAVYSATSHRDNVRVRHVQDLGYAGEAPVIVERTFLSTPRALRSQQSITHSTTIAHGGTNPRCHRLSSDI